MGAIPRNVRQPKSLHQIKQHANHLHHFEWQILQPIPSYYTTPSRRLTSLETKWADHFTKMDIFPMLDTANFYKLFNVSAPNSQNEF